MFEGNPDMRLLEIAGKYQSRKDRGPIYWQFLHTLAFCYESIEYCTVEKFFNILPGLLPCMECREHCRDFIEENTPVFENIDDINNYVLRLHNHASGTGRDADMLYKKHFPEDTS